jgi:hypothetical protein
MKTKKIAFFIIVCFVLTNTSVATTWQTVSNGFWNVGAVWLGGIAPPYTSSDTFLIKHPILLNDRLTLTSGSYFKIDSAGGICGHERVIVNANAKIIKYGILELDTLSIPGGIVNCYSPGLVILTQYGNVSNGGSFYVNTSLAVGPWFDCHFPEYSFLIGVHETNFYQELSVFPNPVQNELNLAFNDFNNQLKEITIIDGIGREIKSISSKENNVKIEMENLVSGFYVLQCKIIMPDNRYYFVTKKFVKN